MEYIETLFYRDFTILTIPKILILIKKFITTLIKIFHISNFSNVATQANKASTLERKNRFDD